jgi:hypothetical protein
MLIRIIHSFQRERKKNIKGHNRLFLLVQKCAIHVTAPYQSSRYDTFVAYTKDIIICKVSADTIIIMTTTTTTMMMMMMMMANG